MRQLFKRTRVLLPLLALLAVPGEGFGQRSWSDSLTIIPGSRTKDGNPAWWNPPFQAANLTDWKRLAAVTSQWHTNKECQDAMHYTRDALDNADIRQSIPHGDIAGEYFIDPEVIVVSAWLVMGGGDLGTLIEEAWHRGTGDSDSTLTALNDSLKTSSVGRTIQECHDQSREEEEDDETCGVAGDGAAADGLAADCNEPKTPRETCTETQEYVRWTDWEWVSKWEWVAKAVSVQTDDGWAYKVVAVQVDNGSYQQVQKGEWQTVRTCTTTTGDAT